jgi:hypothetical protein
MTIPASDIVVVNPGVVGTGGSPLALNGVILSQSLLIPTMGVRSFASTDSVKSFFGAASSEYAIARVYFLGFDNSTIKPGLLYFAPYNLADRSAFLQSGSLAGLTLTQLQALTGVLTITVNGVVFTSTSINLATATSFTNAATIIAAAFTATGKPTVAWNSVISAFVFTSSTAGTLSTISYATGTLSTALFLTAQTGGILSQGAVADTPGTAMDSVKAATQNWVDFMTLFEPVLSDKIAFAVWTNSQNQRYFYAAWDTDLQAIVNGATTSFGAIAKSVGYDGVVPLYNTKELAAFLLGTVASVDFARTNGRITAAFKSQSGFIPTVTDQQIGANLLVNGYSFYGSYATANDQFNFLYNSQMSGKWKYVDPFINQVYLNSQFQLALLSLLTTVKSIPYNAAGYSLIRAAMIDPIEAGLNFGSIRSGIKLSAAQAAVVNQAAGLDVQSIIEQQGYYLQILDPGAQVRGNRGTPVINFWFTDGGAVQKIVVASIDIL